MRLVACAIAAFAALATTTAFAATVITADGYVDVVAGEIVSPAVIVVEGETIAAVNPETMPEGAKTIDLAGHILLPGLSDVHTHLAYEIGPGWQYESVTMTPTERALRGVKNARATLMAGFTTVRDLGSAGFADVALMRAIDAGYFPGPRMIPVGHAISITGGHCDDTGFRPGVNELTWREGVADGVDEVLKAVRYQIKHGAKAIKVCATAGVLSFEGPVGEQQMTAQELRAAVEEAERHGLRVASHAHGTEGIIASAEAGIHSIEHDSLMTREAARIIKRAGTWINPNLYLSKAIPMDRLPPLIRAKAEYVIPKMYDSFKLAVDMDLKIAFGTDAGVYPHGDNAREFAERVATGQPPIDAIRSATIVNAELLGTDDRGRLEAGLLADIIAVQGNPLDDITRLEDVRFVMKGGEVYKGP